MALEVAGFEVEVALINQEAAQAEAEVQGHRCCLQFVLQPGLQAALATPVEQPASSLEVEEVLAKMPGLPVQFDVVAVLAAEYCWQCSSLHPVALVPPSVHFELVLTEHCFVCPLQPKQQLREQVEFVACPQCAPKTFVHFE